MRKVIFLFSLLLSQGLLAQDAYLQGDPSPEVEQKAKELVAAYQPELVMDASQAVLFEKKVIEFLMRAEKIREMNIPASEKPFLLIKLYEQETEEMGNILTLRQLRKYDKVKPRIQPIQGVAPE